MNPLSVSLNQLRKYNVPGPRYTSYPPANHFAETPKIREAQPAPLSLYFHLPFCPSQCLYCGCTNIVTGDQGKSAEYLGYLEREIELRAQQVAEGSEVVQIQLGGGTPTFFMPSEIEQLGQLIQNHFSMAGTVEAGVEIDPRRLTQEKVDALRSAGFNRASLGVQDTSLEVQKTIGRIQPLEQIEQA
ncbi:MAG: radical SAM protein, partial [Kiritimatiellaceae bacterium]|nr:radical SAM protein [Kiritimatiellaceae bacterium]